jgi:hypothetical protein
MKMTKSKIAAFFEEFSFLKNFFNKDLCFDQDSISEVHVSRVVEETMDEPGGRIVFDLEGTASSGKRLILLDGQGKEVAEVGVMPTKKRWCLPWTWSGRRHFYECTSQAMARIGDRANEVRMILKFKAGNDGEHEYWRQCNSITILKSPKGFTVREWFEEIHRRDRAGVQADLTAVDTV